MQGLGVVCNKEEGFGEDDFVVEFLGEVWLYIYIYIYIDTSFMQLYSRFPYNVNIYTIMFLLVRVENMIVSYSPSSSNYL